MTAAKVKTAKTKNTQPGPYPYEGWTVEEILAELTQVVGKLGDLAAKKGAS